MAPGIKLHSEKLYCILISIFAVVLVLTNIIGVKLFLAFPTVFPKGLFGEPITLTTGLITYPLTFLITDFVCEVYGRKRANLMVFTGFGLSILTLCLIEISVILLGVSLAWPSGSQHYNTVSEMQVAYESLYPSWISNFRLYDCLFDSSAYRCAFIPFLEKCYVR